MTDASPNSESRSPSPDTNYSGWGSPPGTGSGSWEPLPDDDSMSNQSNESTDPSDSVSEGGSSNSSDDSFRRRAILSRNTIDHKRKGADW